MNTNIAYLVIASLLVMVFLITRNIKTVDNEYFVLGKTEKTFGLTMSFYASGMGLWILTSPAEVAWYGLGYDIYGYAISAATPFVLIYISVSYTHLRAHETLRYLVCRLLLEKKKK